MKTKKNYRMKQRGREKKPFAGRLRREANKKELIDLERRIELECPKPGKVWVPAVASKMNPDQKSETSEKAAENEKSGILTDYMFEMLPLSERTLDGLHRLRFTRMSKIQALAIPHALTGRDILAEAPTGSGKTQCFVIPILECLFRNRWSRDDGVGAIVITPTRELAAQCFDVLSQFKRHDFSAMTMFGGKHFDREQRMIEGINILIASPGRLQQHLHESANLNVQNLQILVMDEADRLLDPLFKPCIEDIMQSLPPKETRQNLMFSATLGVATKQLIRNFCRGTDNTDTISLIGMQGQVSSTDGKSGLQGNYLMPSGLKQNYCVMKNCDKVNVLYSFLCKNFRQKIIVFCSTVKQVRFLYECYSKLKTTAKILELHGSQDQGKRLGIFDEFKSRKNGITLITTDVAGRGVDFPGIDIVVHMDAPADVETYMHRAGRAARGVSENGISILFLNPHEEMFAKRIQEKSVTINRVHIKAAQTEDISPKLRGLCARNPDIAHLATKAVISYLKSIYLSTDKSIFNWPKIYDERKTLAKSYGLLECPFLDPKYGFPVDGKQLNTVPAKKSKPVDDLQSEDDEISAAFAVDVAKKTEKNKSAFTRLEERIKMGIQDSDDDHKNKLSRREKKMLKIKELREKAKQQKKHGPTDEQTNQVATISEASQMILDDGDVFEEQSADDEDTLAEAESTGDWRTAPEIRKAIRKNRLVIRADGTAKLKGAAKRKLHLPCPFSYYCSVL